MFSDLNRRRRSVCYFLCFVVICSFAPVLNAQQFGAGEGSSCSTNSGKSGICRIFDNCLNIDALYAEGGEPKICGWTNGEAIVCCPQGSATSSSSISEEKCAQYKNIRCPALGNVHTIINGEKVTDVREFPHQVYLGYGSNINNAVYQCGGSLISDQWILTAAHCLNTRSGSPTVADMGFLNTQNRNAFGKHQRIKIVTVVKHPERTIQKYNDIALLKLERPVQMSEYVVPACLHNATQIPTRQAIATGWGKTDVDNQQQSTDLMKVTIKIIDHNTCSQAFKNPDRNLPVGIKEESQFCAGDNNKDTCQGDSGGPLQITHNNFCTHSIIGVTSFGARCGIKPGVYTRVSHYLPWIESVVWPN